MTSAVMFSICDAAVSVRVTVTVRATKKTVSRKDADNPRLTVSTLICGRKSGRHGGEKCCRTVQTKYAGAYLSKCCLI